MYKIPFVSLKIMHEEVENELEAKFHDVFIKSNFIMGTELENFEQEFASYCGAKYAIGCGTGLDALTLILKAYNIGAGDEVLVPSNTFIATALAVTMTGATPVLVEPDITTYTINPSLIEEKITSKTKAIIPVHLYGRCADMDPIKEIADKFHLKVIEDAAQAHGAKYKGRRTGSLGDAAAFSFYPGKNLGALGDGGIVVTDDEKLAHRVRMFGNYGAEIKYHHEVLGQNSRLDEVQASFLRIKLKELDKWNANRQETASTYLSEIKNPTIILPPKHDSIYDSIWHLFVIRCKSRLSLETYLHEKGVETVKHYPVPIHLQKAYKHLCISKGSLPIAEELSETVLSIPMYYGMAQQDIEYVIECINSYEG